MYLTDSTVSKRRHILSAPSEHVNMTLDWMLTLVVRGATSRNRRGAAPLGTMVMLSMSSVVDLHSSRVAQHSIIWRCNSKITRENWQYLREEACYCLRII